MTGEHKPATDRQKRQIYALLREGKLSGARDGPFVIENLTVGEASALIEVGTARREAMGFQAGAEYTGNRRCGGGSVEECPGCADCCSGCAGGTQHHVCGKAPCADCWGMERAHDSGTCHTCGRKWGACEEAAGLQTSAAFLQDLANRLEGMSPHDCPVGDEEIARLREMAGRKGEATVMRALCTAYLFFEHRDRMNAAVHDMKVRWSPLTLLLRDALKLLEGK